MPSITKRVTEARALMATLQSLEKANGVLYWDRAEALYKLKKDNLWKFVYGEGVSSWAKFCTDELHMPLSTADQKVHVYEFFMVDKKFTHKELAGFNTHLLYDIARHSKEGDKKKIIKKLEESETMGKQDFLEVLRGGKQAECGHEHTHEEAEKLVVCGDCGKTIMRKKNGKSAKG